ncbi:MAG: helix-turn-helix domain-containing protein [Bacteroidetes bacterium]|nr:helix-turn-helix domain-containing protein [Bacteroidota bacterium]MCL2302683.1 helix-turn-helix domain-containing protein [Lentimicrobiaceae bacterium]
MNIGNNIKNIRELRNFSQEYVATEVGVSQSTYARIEGGTTIPKIDRLQRIADVLEVDLSTLLSTTNIFHFIFNETANQSGYYINSQTNNNFDIEMLRKIIQEELKKV